MLNIFKIFFNPAWLCENVFTLYGGGKSKAPAAPDYTAAANATAAGNLEAARVAAKANRVSQYTPYGNLVYTQGNGTSAPQFNQVAYDKALSDYNSQQSKLQSSITGGGYYDTASGRIVYPTASASNAKAPNRDDYYFGGGSNDPDVWSATQTLSPDEQSKLDKNNALSLGLLDTAQFGLNDVNKQLSKGFDFSLLPAQQINAGQTAQDAIMARLNPQYDRRQQSLESQLANQGIARGTEAWKAGMTDLDNARNDAYIQAGLQGINTGNAARQQALQEQQFGRTDSLNMINALRTGSQVQQPNFINAPQQQTTAGADLLGAANQQYGANLGAYNAQQAGANNFMGGLMGLGGSAFGAAGNAGGFSALFSDERLKSNIKRIGTHDELGVGIYSYDKFGKPEVGVMAQELKKVKPEAVSTHESGYLMVDYSQL